nr:DNA gyrase C-terminal beta-propeller domain-containing protein [Mycoplasmopsis bovis]
MNTATINTYSRPQSLGIIKKTSLSEFQIININGKRAFNLKENDELIRASIINDDELVLLANDKQRIVKFHSNEFRALSRIATGVKGITLADDETCISASSRLWRWVNFNNR